MVGVQFSLKRVLLVVAVSASIAFVFTLHTRRQTVKEKQFAYVRAVSEFQNLTGFPLDASVASRAWYEAELNDPLACKRCAVIAHLERIRRLHKEVEAHISLAMRGGPDVMDEQLETIDQQIEDVESELSERSWGE
jgi:hypothetical protein